MRLSNPPTTAFERPLATPFGLLDRAVLRRAAPRNGSDRFRSGARHDCGMHLSARGRDGAGRRRI